MEAKLIYRSNRDPIIETPGWYVICAVTGEHITFENLRYWSVERQEAYKDAAASLKRELELRSDTKCR